MARRRRLAFVVSLPLVFLLDVAAMQVAALGQGPGGFKPAGNYQNTSMLGSLNYSDPDTGTNISLFANRQRTVGPASTTDETTMFLNVSAGFGALNINCFLNDNSSDFTVAPDISSATLHKTIAADDPGCGGNLPSDLTLDAAWTGAGPIQSTTITSLFMCGRYTAESHGTDSNNAGTATFDITGLPAPVTAPGPSDSPPVFHFGSSLEHVQGVVPPETCSGSVGRGAGRPTPAAGNYHTTLEQANEFSFSGGSFTFIFADSSSSSSNPVGNGSSSTAQTTLELSTPTTGGCFVIDPGDFLFGGSSASVNTTLTGTTPACGGGTNLIDPDPFPITVTWTGNGPVATTRTESQYSCLGYRFQTNTVQTFEGAATVTVSMPGLSGTLSDPGQLGSIDTRTHADGTPAPGCFFRG